MNSCIAAWSMAMGRYNIYTEMKQHWSYVVCYSHSPVLFAIVLITHDSLSYFINQIIYTSNTSASYIISQIILQTQTTPTLLLLFAIFCRHDLVDELKYGSTGERPFSSPSRIE